MSDAVANAETRAHPSPPADADAAQPPAATSAGAFDAVAAADLCQILDSAPFALAISCEGETVYANAPAAVLAPDGLALRTRTFSVPVAGREFAISVTLDESEQHATEQELIQRAYFDELTGLPNRALMERSVNRLIENGEMLFALAFIDIDGFKHVNDYYGHAVGDKLLERLAARLSSGLRDTDMLARLSGDEFVLLIAPISEPEAVAVDVEWVSERIKEPFFIDGHEIFTSASIGVSLHPQGGDSYELLRSNADRAMYRGKGEAKGSVRFFDETIEHAAVERSRMEQRLRLAIRDKRVCCAYQPKVDLRTGAIAGLEVLMRWRDEDDAVQPPGQFLNLATELGLMDDLTHFILSETVRSIDRIGEAFGRDCSISINVAARQAGDGRFMRSLTEALDATGFASRFMLELTEEAFLSKAEFQDRILPMIRETGARVSIDDFGIGYSSLSALADITADELKVDRSFITEIHRRPRNQSILRAIEALGQSLGMSIVVEGVETFEEVAYLQAATRITYAQGHYFSKPVLLDDVKRQTFDMPGLRAPAPSRADHAGRAAQLLARSQ